MSFEPRRQEARERDAADALSFTRDEFRIPSKAQIQSKHLAQSGKAALANSLNK